MSTTTSTTISNDGEYIDIEQIDRSEDAAGSPITARDNLVAERITYDSGKQAFLVKLEPSHGEGASMYLPFEQVAELRDWLISLNV